MSGDITLKNSTFDHNFGNTYGRAINVGSNLNGRAYYAVNSLIVNNCNFTNNYIANINSSKYGIGHGGAINVLNTTTVKIDKSNFYGNVAYYGKGGTLNFRDQTTSNDNTYTLIVLYSDSEGEASGKFIYLEKDKTYTQAELYLATFIEKDDYAIKYYTDSSYTTKWDYTVTKNMTIYGNWEEHTHEYVGNLILYNNVIYDQCGCGKLGKSLALAVPDNLIYIGKEIGIKVNNEIGLTSYTVTYQYLDKEGNFVDMEEVLVKVELIKQFLHIMI